ncbi:MAG TPA: D-tyrosyl-tRNA(Tyr) deacylase [Lentisphaeria bacterium]|nr:MAG: D-tyrosyl-tRNA(Tyr) deacylase [Lentisphaerae bacterium GWF2_38_69]HBM16540.1 D-tyrosyl-tRNA(Tyr) deacylase [Lentisphaeria bacterium]
MKIVIQRVSHASVKVDDRITGKIDKGFMVLLGITHSDTKKEADFLADKIAGIRIFEDAEGKMNLGLKEVGGAVLLISQFTLYGDAVKGRRPSFSEAARPDQAIPLYEYFIRKIESHGIKVETGIFGAMMEVSLTNSGPVTIIIEK